MSSVSSRILKLSLLVGNLLEHYDSALFSLLSPFFASIFFPEHDYLTALILIYTIIPIGMLARPVGSLFFGHIGDSKGRHEALFWSLLGMAIVTAGIGLIPSYEVIGLAAPLCLAVGRIGQNFFAGGETIGGGVYLIENTPKEKQSMASSYYSSFTVAGIFLGSIAISFFYRFNMIEDYWRVLFLMGSGTAFCAWVLRANNSALALKPAKPIKEPFLSSLKICCSYRQPLATIILVSGFSYASFSTSSLVMNGLIPVVSENTLSDMMHLNVFLLGINMFLLPLFGWLAQKLTNQKLMLLASSIGFASAIPLFLLTVDASYEQAFFIRLAFILIGIAFSAPFYAWAQTLVPANHRYTLVSFGYAVGSQLFGGPTASFSLWMFKQTNSVVAASSYWMLLGLAATIAVFKEVWNPSVNKETLKTER